ASAGAVADEPAPVGCCAVSPPAPPERSPNSRAAGRSSVAGAPRARVPRPPSVSQLLTARHQVLTDEPALQLVGADQLAHDQIVGAIIARFGGSTRQRPRFPEYELMRLNEAPQLRRHALAAARCARNAGLLGNILRERERHAAQSLNALRDRIHDFDLFAVVLVEQQMQLVEGRPGGLPMRFLIEVTHGHGVRQHTVERPHALMADLLGKSEARGLQAAEGLDDRLFVTHRALLGRYGRRGQARSVNAARACYRRVPVQCHDGGVWYRV